MNFVANWNGSELCWGATRQG